MSPIPEPVILRFAGGTTASPTPLPLTMRDLARAYLADRRADMRNGAISPEHLEHTRQHLRSLIRRRRWAVVLVEQFTARTMRRWLRSNPGWKSPHQLDGVYRDVRSMLIWAENEDLISKSPIRGFRRYWPTPAPRKACRPHEYTAIMAAIRNRPGRRRRPSAERLRVQLWVLWNLGCRTSELRAACWENLDLDRGILVLPKHKTSRKTGRGRTVYLSDRAIRVLSWLTRRGRPASGPIFTARCGKPLDRTSWNRIFAKYRTMAGVRQDVTQYSLRHGYCVEALQAGVGESELAALMGHSSTRMIAWYARDLRQRTEHLRAAASKAHPAAKPIRRSAGGEKLRSDQPLLF